MLFAGYPSPSKGRQAIGRSVTPGSSRGRRRTRAPLDALSPPPLSLPLSTPHELSSWASSNCRLLPRTGGMGGEAEGVALERAVIGMGVA